MFFNEIELLEIRLSGLYDFVDKFIVIESSQTFSGLFKKSILQELTNLKLKYGKKLEMITRNEFFKSYDDIVVNLRKSNNFNSKESEKLIDILESHNHYDKQKLNLVLDTYQREACAPYIERLTNKEDIIIFSDADELPDNINDIKKFFNKRKNSKYIISLLQHEFWYYPNIYHASDWEGSISGISSEITKKSLNYWRMKNGKKRINTLQIDGLHGYHLTNMGGAERLKEKIKNWSHQEFNNNFILGNLEERIIRGEDVFKRTTGTVTKLINLKDIYSKEYIPSIEKSKLPKAKELVITKPNTLKILFNKLIIKIINFFKK